MKKMMIITGVVALMGNIATFVLNNIEDSFADTVTDRIHRIEAAIEASN